MATASIGHQLALGVGRPPGPAARPVAARIVPALAVALAASWWGCRGGEQALGIMLLVEDSRRGRSCSWLRLITRLNQ